jgi:pimeloyl-ACP methyl ester carboxylesterase
MSQFLLIHGGAMGPWVWELLEPELIRRGHTTVAVDLPVEDVSVGLAGYVDATCEQMEAALAPGGDVVLVGHSMSGNVIPFVAKRRQVQALVFLCAGIPGVEYEPAPDTPIDAGRPDDQHRFTVDDQNRIVISPEHAIGRYFQDCPPDVAARMAARLRPQSQEFRFEECRLDRWPDTRRFYISCSEDQSSVMMKVPDVRAALGVEPIQMPGGHCPMVSRPAALAELLHLMAQASSVAPS